MTAPKGYSSQEKDQRLLSQFATVEPVRTLQNALSVLSHEFVYQVGTDAAEAGSTSSVIVATGHAALKGDVILITSGTHSGKEIKVWEVSTNSITLAETLPSAVAAAVTFSILRHKYPTVESTGEVKVSGTFTEVATAADGGALPALTKVVSGYDGTNVQVLKTDAAGELQVDVLSSALPTGAATEATLSTLATEATVSTLATEATVSTLATEATVSQLSLGSTQTDGTQKTQIVDGSGNVISSTLNALDVNLKSPVVVDVSLSEANDSVAVFGSDGTVNRALKTDASGELQIDVLSSALPTGAATAAKQPALGTAGTASADVITVQGIASMTALKVDGSAVTQPISAASLPLPSGASTSAAQTDGTQKAQIVDGSGNVIGSTGNALDVNLKSPIVVDVNLDEADDSVAVFGYDGTVNRAIKTDASGELQVDILSSALPTGAATETTLNAIKTAVELIDNAISGNELQVDVVTSALPAGAATETTLLAIEADTTSLAGCVSGSEIQVDVVSSALPTGAATEVTLADIKTAVQLIDNAISGNEMQVDVKLIEGVMDANNTTSTPLLAGGNFTGAWTEIKDYNSINLGVFSDVGSATDGLRIEYSFDGVSVHHFHLWTFAGGANGVGYQLSAEFRYFRINYTNGASPQTTFLLQSNLKPTALFPSSYRASQTFSSQSQVILTKGIIVGETTAGGGGYVAVKVNPSGALTVEADITSSVLPTGAATETTLADIKTSVQLLDNAISGNELQVDVVTSALPTGAATETTLASIEGDTSSLAGCVSGTEVQVDVVSSALPSGAATETTLADIKTSVQLLDNAVSGNELQVDVVAPLPAGTNNIGDVDVVSIVPSTGRSAVTRARNVYSVTPVTTGAYVQLVASLGAAVNEVEIFDSSGETLVIATGAISSEVDQVYVFPGGNGRIPLAIASGARVSVKAVSATASAGEIAINFYS